MQASWLIVVEGKHDVAQVHAVAPQLEVVATHGWPSQIRLNQLRRLGRGRPVALLTDGDSAGQRIRAELHEVFPKAIDIYIRRSFNGVEHAPLTYLARRLERAGIIDEAGSFLETDRVIKAGRGES